MVRILSTGFMQAGIQVLTFAAGLVVIRMLPLEEYAYYTIANAALGTLIVLTDSGIAQSVMARGGKVWTSATELGGVVASGLWLRRRFALVALLVSLPLLVALLLRQGASSLTAAVVTLSILPLFVSTLSGQVFEVVPRLHQQLRPLQTIQLSGAVLRLVTLTASVSVLPAAWLASVAAGLAQMWTTARVRRLAAGSADLGLEPDAEASRAIGAQVRRMAPGAIYFAFSGQITIWLISVVGTTDAVAHVGALGRLAMAFNVVSAVVALLVVPRFARLSGGSPRAITAGFWRVQAGLIAILTLAVVFVAAFPGLVLALLGPGYASLTAEVVLAAAGGALAMLAGSAYTLAAARSIVAPAWFFIPFALSLQAALLLVLPIASTAGVLWLGLLTNLCFWLLHACYFTWSAGTRGAA